MTIHLCKATIEIGEAKVTFEGTKEFVEEQVKIYSLSRIRSKIDTKKNNMKSNGTDEMLSEHDLVTQKQPKGHAETVAVLAFALKVSGKEEFTEEDIRKAYIRSRVRPPKVVGQAIRDAKNAFDYIESGSERGTYKLSHHGDRTVRFDLPREQEHK
jgi:hypothetical protein